MCYQLTKRCGDPSGLDPLDPRPYLSISSELSNFLQSYQLLHISQETHHNLLMSFFDSLW